MTDLQSRIVNNQLNVVISSLFEHIDSTIDHTKSLVAAIQGRNIKLQDRKILILNEALEVMVQSIIALHSKYKAFESYSQKDMDIVKATEMHLLSILKGIKMAIEKEDHVILIDLIEYELRDNLTQWKIRVLPRLKNLIS